MAARTQEFTNRSYRIDLYLKQESHTPDLRKEMQVWSNSLSPSGELLQEVMLMYEIPFVARAVVEQFEGTQVVATVTHWNVHCAL